MNSIFLISYVGIAVVIACVAFGAIGIYKAMDANTHSHSAQIKSERAACIARGTKLPKKAKIMIIVMTVVTACLVAVPPMVDALNKFNYSKVARVVVGHSRSDVKRILGKPDETDQFYDFYCSGNYKKILKAKNADAGDINDLNDLENAFDDALKAEAEAQSTVYKYIKVFYGNVGNREDVVTGWVLDRNACDAPDYKPDRRSGISFWSTAVGSIEIPCYMASFSDGSAEMQILSDYTIEESNHPGSVEITVSGRLGTYSVDINETEFYKMVGYPSIYNSKAFSSFRQVSFGDTRGAVETLLGKAYKDADNKYVYYNGALANDKSSQSKFNASDAEKKAVIVAFNGAVEVGGVLYDARYAENMSKTVARRIDFSVITDAGTSTSFLEYSVEYTDGSFERGRVARSASGALPALETDTSYSSSDGSKKIKWTSLAGVGLEAVVTSAEHTRLIG